jgi:hypothetical protein
LKRRKALVEALLKKHDSATRSRIVDECRKDFEDVGMGDIVLKHYINNPFDELVQEQEAPMAQGRMAGDDELLALRMQAEEWGVQAVW